MARRILAGAVIVTALPAAAADEPIVTDRPDFVDSSSVVGKHRLQIETSFALDRSSDKSARSTLRSTPTMVRFGVSDDVELRVQSDGALRERTRAANGATQREIGAADMSLGLKWHALDGAGAMPSVGVVLNADLSSGSAAFREPGTRPSARVTTEWELPHALSFGAMSGLGYEHHAGGRKPFGILGAVVGKSFTDRLRGFAEVSAPRIRRSAWGGTEAMASAGAAYLIKNNLQVDAALSRGLNSRSPDLSLTVGLSIRL